ncbi:MAG: aspartate carbamoyltransferase regulatory subunit [Prevotella sp.]|uniref:aspartate carbamoyltransferase regulatory subunit n=1 Tax=Prevotella sp. P5-92 TaxID=2024222 RepID=UPI000B969B15|nr:aspartate carbamoyltransferase regulatory subunit [Prevotella sp. P5-92]MCI7400551.1 aspartate carbamoyltransferase regulatory subunit [Prevotella sp.]MDD6820536.1 aspartate carbamoyltransferase regulatory subunit [Prevotella sp.]MDY4654042.1 aspartate carbamoyltransferase regulatory subunit [Prevotella sp.]OYP59733.1 aspartate carbamoyltransferase regulatory subunit [Prevotella sp. P5-92]
MAKNEIMVTAIENGTVIDHIPTEKTFEVATLLNLESLSTPVTIGYNYRSKKIGRKGIIKVADKFFTDEEISRLSVVAPNVVLNVINDYEVVEKKTVTTPDELRGIVKCNNPKCITNNEPMDTLFHVVDKEHGVLRCHYCEKEQDINKVKLTN